MTNLKDSALWTIVDKNGDDIINFTSFMSIEVKNEGQSASYPQEEGGFTSYNKTEKPLHISVLLGIKGNGQGFEYTLSRLDAYKKSPSKLSVITPSKVYPNMTLESYSYAKKQGANASMLTVDLSLVEIREVKNDGLNSIITSPKNPTSALNINTGKTQAKIIHNIRSLS